MEISKNTKDIDANKVNAIDLIIGDKNIEPLSKEEFEAKWKNGITPEQMKENLHKRIEKLFADKK